MATLSKLVEDKALIRVVIPLKRGQFDDRKFYAFPACVEWMKSEVPNMVTGRIKAPMTPLEQLRERLRQWNAGEPMRDGPWFHDIEPKESGVWELKTFDLRVFGWMYRPREFIAFCGGYTDDYKAPTKTKTYGDERAKVVAARDALPLDGEKFVVGEFDELV